MDFIIFAYGYDIYKMYLLSLNSSQIDYDISKWVMEI